MCSWSSTSSLSPAKICLNLLTVTVSLRYAQSGNLQVVSTQSFRLLLNSAGDEGRYLWLSVLHTLSFSSEATLSPNLLALSEPGSLSVLWECYDRPRQMLHYQQDEWRVSFSLGPQNCHKRKWDLLGSIYSQQIHLDCLIICYLLGLYKQFWYFCFLQQMKLDWSIILHPLQYLLENRHDFVLSPVFWHLSIPWVLKIVIDGRDLTSLLCKYGVCAKSFAIPNIPDLPEMFSIVSSCSKLKAYLSALPTNYDRTMVTVDSFSKEWC